MSLVIIIIIIIIIVIIITTNKGLSQELNLLLIVFLPAIHKLSSTK